MLPGLRFLCAALVLSMSLLVFGFGATALLRSARLDAASLPALRAPPETVFAQPEPQPRLAMLRVEPPANHDTPAAVAVPAPAPIDPVPPSIPALTEADRTAAPEKMAALSPPQATAVELPQPPQSLPEVVTEIAKPSAPADVAKLEIAPAIETPAPALVADAAPVMTAAAAPTATAEEPAPPAAAPAATEPPPIAVAALVGPAVTVTPVAAAKPVAFTPKPKEKKTARKRTLKRKRVAERSAPAPQQQPLDPFAQFR